MSGLLVQALDLRGKTMSHQQQKIFHLLLLASFIGILTGCANQHTNSQLTIRVSGDTEGISFEGQCTAQKAEFGLGESVAQNLDVKGTVHSVNQTQDYETHGYFIYCSVANQLLIFDRIGRMRMKFDHFAIENNKLNNREL